MEGKKTKIAIIGGGNMGGAITMALSKKEEYEVFLYERTMEKAKALLDECPITLLSSISEAVDMDCVIIALKPQNLPSFYHKLQPLAPKLFISICAGVDLETLKNNLGCKDVVRFMPNIGAKVGKSVTAVAADSTLREELLDLSLDIAASFGDAFLLDESHTTKLFQSFQEHWKVPQCFKRPQARVQLNWKLWYALLVEQP